MLHLKVYSDIVPLLGKFVLLDLSDSTAFFGLVREYTCAEDQSSESEAGSTIELVASGGCIDGRHITILLSDISDYCIYDEDKNPPDGTYNL